MTTPTVTTPAERWTALIAKRIAALPQRSDRYISERASSYNPTRMGTYQRAVVAEAQRRGLVAR